jgi:anti-anti-sigma regulatory factor
VSRYARDVDALECTTKKKNMPTRITQVDSPERAATRLKVEGSLYLADAEILERICRDIQQQSHNDITLDLSDISFLDSDSAEVLCRLKNERGVKLEGLHLFIQKVIELVEKTDEDK